MTDYYLSAGATRHDGRRYVRGDKLPDEVGKKLAERGLATDDRATLTRDLRPFSPSAASESKAEQRSTLGPSQTSADDPAPDLADLTPEQRSTFDDLNAELKRREAELDEREEALNEREAGLKPLTPEEEAAKAAKADADAKGAQPPAGTVTVNEAQKPATPARRNR